MKIYADLINRLKRAEEKAMDCGLPTDDSALLSDAREALESVSVSADERKDVSLASTDAMTPKDLELFRHTVEQFDDCNETDAPYESLMHWVNIGLLECEHFTVTTAGRALLNQ